MLRRLSRFCGSLAVLAAILWCVLWVLGRDALAEFLDDEVERLRAEGYGVSIGRTDFSGFPFALSARFEDLVFVDAASGARTELPELTTVLGLAPPGRLLAALPERMTLALPVGPGLRDALPALGPTVEVEVEVRAAGLALVAEAAEGGPALGLLAERLEIVPAAPLQGLDFRLSAREVSARLSRGGAGGSASLEAARLALSLDTERPSPAEGAAPERLSHRIEAEGLDLEARAAEPKALGEILAGRRPGEAGMRLAAARLSAAVAVAGAGAGDGRIAAETGETDLRLAVEGETLALEAALGAIALALEPADAADPRRGRLLAERLALSAHHPFAAGPEMRDLGLSARLDGLTPSEPLWARLDPEGRLPRAPGRLAVEIAGTGRFLAPLGDTPPGAAQPFELGNLSLLTLEAEALGARARATGDLEFIQPIYEPRGAVAVRLDGVLGLLKRLKAAGLIDEQALQRLATAAAVYTRGGSGPDDLRIDLRFDEQGLHLNEAPPATEP